MTESVAAGSKGWTDKPKENNTMPHCEIQQPPNLWIWVWKWAYFEKNCKKNQNKLAFLIYCVKLSARFQSKTVWMRPKQCSGGGTGRRVRLRSVWSDPWGFKSPLEYQNRIFFMSGFDKPGVGVYINNLTLLVIAVQGVCKTGLHSSVGRARPW